MNRFSSSPGCVLAILPSSPPCIYHHRVSVFHEQVLFWVSQTLGEKKTFSGCESPRWKGGSSAEWWDTLPSCLRRPLPHWRVGGWTRWPLRTGTQRHRPSLKQMLPTAGGRRPQQHFRLAGGFVPAVLRGNHWSLFAFLIGPVSSWGRWLKVGLCCLP